MSVDVFSVPVRVWLLNFAPQRPSPIPNGEEGLQDLGLAKYGDGSQLSSYFE